MTGSIYFLRHGETDANEQNYLAGIFDVPLSELGKKQAKDAGRIILKKGLKFDEVHTSDLVRTKDTAFIALKESGQEKMPFVEAPEIRERDFGIFAKLNKNLLKKSIGYANYEKKLHSPLEFPDSGETFQSMYDRVRKYYYSVLAPALKQGKSILVVCHKYIIEMFAMIFAGLNVDDYFDFRMPNAKPMNRKDLVSYIKSESKTLKEISDRITYLSSWIIIIAAFSGILLKTVIGRPLNSHIFLITASLLLGISTFFIAIGLNSNCIINSFRLTKPSMISWYIKFAIVGSLFLLFKGHVESNLLVLFLMPPAFTAPVLSLLWGGNLYLAIEKTFLLSLLAPIFIGAVFFFSSISFHIFFMPFLFVMVFSMFVPACIAQSIRIKKPIAIGKFAEHWKWLGILSVILLSFLSTYHFTPADFIELWSGNPTNSSLFFKQGLMVFFMLLLIKLFSYYVSRYSSKNDANATDIYITHATPNIFLWISCISFQADTGYIAFWACVAFFMGILIDEFYFVNKFKRSMLFKKNLVTYTAPVNPVPVQETIINPYMLTNNPPQGT